MRIQDSVILITGASEGIGRATALAFGRRGARLSLNALSWAGLKEIGTDETLFAAGDITRDEVRQELVAQTLQRFGRIDVLVNNAGVGLYAYPSRVSIELARRVFELNVFAALALAQLVIPGMRERRHGTIVNVGSIGGKVALPWASMYCASKFALHAVSDSLRRELAPYGIRVCSVYPGIVDTGFREHVLGGRVPERVRQIRKVVKPDKVAEAIVVGVERDARTVYCPRIAHFFSAIDFLTPRLMDRYISVKFGLDSVTGPDCRT